MPRQISSQKYGPLVALFWHSSCIFKLVIHQWYALHEWHSVWNMCTAHELSWTITFSFILNQNRSNPLDHQERFLIQPCTNFSVSPAKFILGVFSSQLGRLKHSLAAALVVLDLCLCAIPIRLIHVLYPVLVGIVYSLFSYVFWLSGIQGPLNVGQVYPGLNWSLPRTAILTCLCVILFSFLMQVGLRFTCTRVHRFP